MSGHSLPAMGKMQKTDQPETYSKAVAVSDEGTGAPVIIAKGHGFNAEKILDIAFTHGVKVRQDRGLTDLLDAFEVESPIPLEALHAVSLILERVYQEEGRLTGDEGATANETDMTYPQAQEGEPNHD